MKGLIIFARQPVPGRVKTRLARDVGDEAAAILYAAMIEDTLEQVIRLNLKPLLFWSLEEGAEPPETYSGVQAHAQQGADLGERMANAFKLASASCSTCCIIGTDSPSLPPAYVSQAFDYLEKEQADLVFGPAEDGGYYLLGIRGIIPDGLFDGIPWSTGQVLEKSLEQAERLGLRTALLPPWYDIDTMEDLLRLTRSDEASRTSQTARGILAKFSSAVQGYK